MNLLELPVKDVGLQYRIYSVLPAEVHRRSDRPDLAALAGQRHFRFTPVRRRRTFATAQHEKEHNGASCDDSSCFVHEAFHPVIYPRLTPRREPRIIPQDLSSMTYFFRLS